MTTTTHQRPVSLATRLHDLADRVARLGPCRRDPEAFHIEKHTLAVELRQVALSVKENAQ